MQPADPNRIGKMQASKEEGEPGTSPSQAAAVPPTGAKTE